MSFGSATLFGMRFETKVVHAGLRTDQTGAVAPPIHLSTTFERNPASEPIGADTYIRESNPTQTQLENALAALEGGEAALAFASGMAAGVSVIQSLPPGSHAILPDDCYFTYRSAFEEYFSKWGFSVSIVDMSDTANVRSALTPKTRLIWMETPSNPQLKIVDIAAISEIAAKAGAFSLLDNTWATPALQRPLELGTGISMHSTTKYFGGHSDVMGGALMFAKKDDFFEKCKHTRSVMGGVPSPFNSWLVMRGIRTLACRMRVHSDNAMMIASALEGHPALSQIHFPGLKSDPGHRVAAKQMSGFGGMMSIRVKAGKDAAMKVVSRVKIFTRATSLGGTESLIEHRASSEGPGSRTPQDLLRLSIGLEHPDDLITDLKQALEG
jgi:cystathionine gamma-synthase